MFAEIPAFLKPVAKFSMIKWGFDGCVGAEFKGLDFTCDDLEDMIGAPMAKKMSQRGYCASSMRMLWEAEPAVLQESLQASGAAPRWQQGRAAPERQAT